MPLPAALAARLAKRGIVSKVKVKETKKDDVEEVFAEDYDEDARTDSAAVKPAKTDDVSDELIHEVINCPNKWNPHHKCVDYCVKRWGLQKFKKKLDMEPKRLRMLRRHPLPEGWKEVGDPVTGRYYYWNTITDEVSWLSPRHPKSEVSRPAEKIKELIGAGLGRTDDAQASQVDDNDGMEYEEDSASDDEEDMEDDFEELERQILQEKAKREKERKAKGGGKKKEEELDPMDPASYSDIPRGTWSTGLERKGMAKTGVDATANGPLFQQRPYPSPGAVLRANREAQK